MLVGLVWLSAAGLLAVAAPSVRAAAAGEAAQLEEAALAGARAWASAASIEAAAADFERAAAMWASAGVADKRVYCMRMRAKVLLVLGRQREAKELLEEARSAAEKAGAAAERGKALIALAQLAVTNGDLVAADRWLVLAGDSESFEVSIPRLIALGDIEYYKRDIESAFTAYQQALSLADQNGDLEGASDARLAMAYGTLTKCNYSEGLAWALQAASGYESLGDRRGIAFANIARGHILTTIDDKQAALDAYGIAEGLFPEGVDRVEAARLYNGIGAVYEDYGRWDTSLEYRERALRLFEAEGHTFGQLATLPSLATLSYLSGNDAAADVYFRRSAQLARALNDRFGMAVVKENAADYAAHTGDAAKARELYKELLEESEKAGLKHQLPKFLTSIGCIEAKSGRPEDALRYLDKAVEMSRQLLNPIQGSHALYCLASVNERQGRIDDARRAARESVEIADEMYYNVANQGLRATYMANVYDRYRLNISLEMADPNDPERVRAALSSAERIRGRSLLEELSLSDSKILIDGSRELIDRERELRARLSAKLDEIVEARDDAAKTDTLRGEAKKLQDELDAVTAEIRRKSPFYSAVRHPEPFDVAAFQRDVLNDDTVFLEFALGEKESYLWTVDTSAVRGYVIPSRGEIEKRVDDLLELARSREARPDDTPDSYGERNARADQAFPAAASELSRMILGPAANDLKKRKLIISTDGRLSYFPIGALPDPATGEPLLTTRGVSYTPSASILAVQKTLQKGRPESAATALVFADPVFSKNDPRLNAGSGGDAWREAIAMLRSADAVRDLPRLPASESEAAAIAGTMPGATVVSGFSANRRRVLDPAISDYKILHFATHGVLDTDHPELSGILLSLFDETGLPNEGFIRSQDIYGMKLNADLVVLSACNTGSGRNVRGEGIMSLNNAFMQAGARSLVSSLWKVDDKATELLMTRFYERLATGGVTVPQALTDAQNYLRQDPRYGSPFYWAAFTANGDAGVVIEPRRGSKAARIAAASLAIAPFVLILVWWFRRKRYSTVNV